MYNVPLLQLQCMDFVQIRSCTVDGIRQCCELALRCEKECPKMLKICFKALSNLDICNRSDINLRDASTELIERIAKDCPRTNCFTEDRIFIKVC